MADEAILTIRLIKPMHTMLDRILNWLHVGLQIARPKKKQVDKQFSI